MKTTEGAKGFSLVEVLCAILILGVGLVGLTYGVSTALTASKESELQTGAALLAAGQIELLRADGIIVDGETESGTGDGTALYQWKQIVTSTAIDGLHEVTVTILNAKSGQEIYELRTLLFDPPIYSGASQSESNRQKERDRDRSKRSERRRR